MIEYLNFFLRLPCWLALGTGLATTTRSSVRDVGITTALTRHREDRSRWHRKGGTDYCDFERRQFRRLSIALLNTPMKILLQIRHHHLRFEGIEMGMLCDSFVEMNESFDFDIRPLPAIPAASYECVDGANKIGTHQPFVRIVRNTSEEEQDRETGAEFIFLETGANGPFVYGA